MSLNETMIGVAIPQLMFDLAVDASDAQWINSSFMLTIAVVVSTTGFLIQRFTTRFVYFLGTNLFVLGSILACVAPGCGELVFARMVQASGTAMIMPLLTTTAISSVPQRGHGRVMSGIAIVMSMAPALGPSIGGYFLTTFNWRWIFGSGLAVMLPVMLISFVRLPNVSETCYVRLDIRSVLLSAIGFGGLILGLNGLGKGTPIFDIPIWRILFVSLISLTAFIWRQVYLQRKGQAFLDLRTFGISAFVIASAVLAVSMMSMFGTLLLLPIYMQLVLGMDAMQSGLVLFPGGLTIGLAAPLVGVLFDKLGPRAVIIPGAAVASASLWAMTGLTQSTPVAMLVVIHVAFSAGLAFIFTPLMTTSLGSLPSPLLPHGSAIIKTIQQLAGAAGIALFVSIYSRKAALLQSTGSDLTQATTNGIQLAFTWSASLSLIALVISFAIGRTNVTRSRPPAS